jgi:hypothetical protein
MSWLPIMCIVSQRLTPEMNWISGRDEPPRRAPAHGLLVRRKQARTIPSALTTPRVPHHDVVTVASASTGPSVGHQEPILA